MTGYGRGIAQSDDITVVVEGRSLNHRFFDINIKLPVSSYTLEKKIRDIIKSYFHRGKMDVYVSISKFTSLTELPVNYENASKYYQALCKLSNHLGIKEKINLSLLIPFIREIIGVQEQDLDVDIYWPIIKEALQEAIQSIREMRISEGKSLYEDIKPRVDYINTIIEQINKKFPQLIQELREQLSAKIAEHFPNVSIDSERLEQELVITAEKIDITEELIRTGSHLHQLGELLLFDGPIGRKLDFLLQEIHREVNTLGYKSNNIVISQQTVEIKSELEKIREQIQNIE